MTVLCIYNALLRENWEIKTRHKSFSANSQCWLNIWRQMPRTVINQTILLWDWLICPEHRWMLLVMVETGEVLVSCLSCILTWTSWSLSQLDVSVSHPPTLSWSSWPPGLVSTPTFAFSVSIRKKKEQYIISLLLSFTFKDRQAFACFPYSNQKSIS